MSALQALCRCSCAVLCFDLVWTRNLAGYSTLPPVQAFFIIQDPYANAYYLKWKEPSSHSKSERLIGRGGWVATRNYELVCMSVCGQNIAAAPRLHASEFHHMHVLHSHLRCDVKGASSLLRQDTNSSAVRLHLCSCRTLARISFRCCGTSSHFQATDALRCCLNLWSLKQSICWLTSGPLSSTMRNSPIIGIQSCHVRVEVLHLTTQVR